MDDLTHLALRAGRGDAAAVDAFIRAAMPDVWRLCGRLGGMQAVEDLTQETFLRTIKSLPSFRAESNARTWVLAIARHVCADRVRERQRARRLLNRIGERGTDTVELPRTDVEVVELIDALDPERREAIILTQELGLSYAEAAEVSGCAVGTIRSRVFRARIDLLEMVEERPLGRRDDASGRRRSTG